MTFGFSAPYGVWREVHNLWLMAYGSCIAQWRKARQAMASLSVCGLFVYIEVLMGMEESSFTP